MAAERAPFPTEVAQFAGDDRVSYSHEMKTYILEDEQGVEWEWLASRSKWTQTMDETLKQQQAEIYKIPGVDDNEPALNPAQKRKEALLEDPESNPKNAKADARHKANAGASATPSQNKAVFVTGLPTDTDTEEVRDYFKKFGMISESVDDDGKRITLYTDKDGKLKGEALIIYHRSESVRMAIAMGDNAVFIRDDPKAPTGRITVAEADYSYKANKDDTVAEERTKAKPRASRAQAKKKAQEMDSRLADWSDDDISAKPAAPLRDSKTIVLKNVFTLDELREDPYAVQEIHEEMMEIASKFGEVKNVTIFDLEEEGVVTIRFGTDEATMKCGMYLDGRKFGHRKVSCDPATGNEKFKKSRKVYIDKEAEEAKRLEEYSAFIEGKGGKDGAKGDGSS